MNQASPLSHGTVSFSPTMVPWAAGAESLTTAHPHEELPGEYQKSNPNGRYPDHSGKNYNSHKGSCRCKLQTGDGTSVRKVPQTSWVKCSWWLTHEVHGVGVGDFMNLVNFSLWSKTESQPLLPNKAKQTALKGILTDSMAGTRSRSCLGSWLVLGCCWQIFASLTVSTNSTFFCTDMHGYAQILHTIKNSAKSMLLLMLNVKKMLEKSLC